MWCAYGGLLIIIRAMIDEGGVQMSMRLQVTGLMSSKYVTLKFKKFFWNFHIKSTLKHFIVKDRHGVALFSKKCAILTQNASLA